MAITIRQIEDKVFSMSSNGYMPFEVDNFLDDICDHLLEMEGKVARLEKQLKEKDEALKQKPQLDHWSVQNSKAENHIDSAQMVLQETTNACNKVLEDAKKRADDIIALAKSSSGDNLLMRLELRKKTLTEEISFLQKTVENLRTQINDMLRV